MGNTAKKWDNVCYLSHLGTEPFLWFWWEKGWRMQINKSVICSITVMSRIGDFHGKYREKTRWRGLFVAWWYWGTWINSMGDNMKTVDKSCYLWHHGTEPFWWFSWELPQKIEISRGMRGVLVPSRLCDIDGKYHETNRQCVLFVASGYWAVLVNCVENIMKQNWDRACHL